MMDSKAQLKLQAFFDGELSEPEAREMAAWLARETEAADLLKEFRHTRQALSGFEPALKLPETREFYWSKIEREIRRLEPEFAREPSPSLSWLARLRRLLIPVGAVAAVVAIVMVAGLESGRVGPPAVSDSEMTTADSGTFTYHDYANGTTLIWLSYPAER